MLEALGWGLLAQSSLLIAGLLVCWVTVPTKLVGILGGFGAGAMIAARTMLDGGATAEEVVRDLRRERFSVVVSTFALLTAAGMSHAEIMEGKPACAAPRVVQPVSGVVRVVGWW